LILVGIAGGGGGADTDTSLDIWTSVKNEVMFEQAIENDISGFLLSYTFSRDNGYLEEDDRERIKDYITDSMCVLDNGENRFLTLQEILEKVASSNDEMYEEFVDTLKINFSFEPTQDGKYPYPLEQFSITSMYGERQNPTGNGTRFHNGMDLVGSEPYAPIISITDGDVVNTNTNKSGLGNYVIIKYIDETGVFYGVYGHMSGLLVNVGDEVEEGEVIGLQGGDPDVDPNAGDTTGRHLHFEIRQRAFSSSSSVDPAEYIM
ncbi:MAG: M23 family metallopeptidase, partial [Oscillospiraceae bacterium]